MKGIFKLALITASISMAGAVVAAPGNTGDANVNFTGNVVDSSCTINAADMVHDVAVPDIDATMFQGMNLSGGAAVYEQYTKVGNSANLEIRFENCPSSQTTITPVATITTGSMKNVSGTFAGVGKAVIPEGTAKGYMILMANGDNYTYSKSMVFDGGNSPTLPIVANAATYKLSVATVPDVSVPVKVTGDYNATVDIAFNYS